MPYIRIGEGTVLKAVGLKGLQSSSLWCGAKAKQSSVKNCTLHIPGSNR